MLVYSDLAINDIRPLCHYHGKGMIAVVHQEYFWPNGFTIQAAPCNFRVNMGSAFPWNLHQLPFHVLRTYLGLLIIQFDDIDV